MSETLSGAWYLAIADLRHMLRRRETLLWTFALPVVFFYFVGTVTSGFGRAAGPGDQIGVAVPEDTGFLADQLLDRLAKGGYNVVRVPRVEELNRFDRRMSIPSNFSSSVLAGKPVKVEFSRKGAGLDGDYDSVRLSKAVYTLLADVIVVSKDGKVPDAGSLQKFASAPRAMSLETKPAGRRLVIPSGFEQAVPGTMVFFLMLVLLTNGGVTLAVERDQGILRRLASSPLPRSGVVLGKWGARMLLAGIQIAFCMLTGSVLFGVYWGSQIAMVLVVLFAYASLAAACGILIGTFARSRGQAAAMGAISANVLASVGGCWWPAEIMPRTMQAVAKLSPAGLAMDALHQLVNFGSGPMSALPHAVVLGLGAIAAGAMAARWFRFH